MSRAVRERYLEGGGGGCIFLYSCSAGEISFQIDQFELTDCIIHKIFKNIEM